MRDVFIDFKLPDKPVMILGKGQSLDLYDRSMMKDHYVIGINQVGNHVPVDITFLIHGEHVTDNAMILPYYPHIGKKPGPISLDTHGFHYNLNTAPTFYRKTPVITTDGFTIHALLNVLGLLGARTIRTLGVDGGHGYSKIINQETHCNFDLQFPEIDKLVTKYNFDYEPFGNTAGHRDDLCQRVG